MSARDPQLALALKAQENLDYVLGPAPGRSKPRLILAVAHLTDWLARRMPRGEIRGGSSSSRATEDLLEERRLARSVEADQLRLRELLGRIASDTDELYRLIARNVETVDLRKLGNEAVATPMCSHCRREERGTPKEVGKDSTLCTWCHRFSRHYGAPPPSSVLEARAQGRRITEAMIASALPKAARRRKVS